MQIGPYTTRSLLGRGAQGSVFLASDAQGAEVALKVLGRSAPGALARFERERQLQAELGLDAGFVPILDAGSSEQGPYLIMPVVSGGTLRERLSVRRGSWPMDEVIELGRQLTRALGLAHARGIVHRDLKPGNVLFDERGQPLVADLGLAKHFGGAAEKSLSKTGELRGTIGYMPPEQMRNAKHVGPPADVFALGVILYEALCGVHPFQGETALLVLAAVEAGDFTPTATLRPDGPAWLRDAIERSLSAEPSERFAEGAAFAAALVEPAPSAGRRGRALAPVLALTLALGLLVWGLSRLAGGPPPAPAPGSTARTSPPPRSSASPAEGGGVAPSSSARPALEALAPVPGWALPFARSERMALTEVWSGPQAATHRKRIVYSGFLSSEECFSLDTLGVLRMWDVETGELRRRVQLPAPKSTRVVRCGDLLLRWGGDGRLLHDFAGRALPLPPEIKRLSAALPVSERVAILFCGPLLHRVDLARGRVLATQPCKSQRLTRAGADRFVTFFPLQLRDLNTLEIVHELMPSPAGGPGAATRDGRSLFVHYSLYKPKAEGQGRRLDARVSLLSLEDGRPLWNLEGGGAGLHSPLIVGGRVFAIAERGLFMLDLASGAAIPRPEGFPRDPQQLSLSPGRDLLLAAGHYNLHVRSLDALERDPWGSVHRTPIVALDVSPVSSQVLALSADRDRFSKRSTTLAWGADQRAQVRACPPLSDLAISPDGTRAALGLYNALEVIDLATSSSLLTLAMNASSKKRNRTSVSWGPEGRWLVAGNSAKPHLRIVDLTGKLKPKRIEGFTGSVRDVAAVAGERAVVVCGGRGSARIAHLGRLKLERELLPPPRAGTSGYTRVTASAAGDRFLLQDGGGFSLWRPGGDLPEWSVATPLRFCELSPSGERILVASKRGVELWGVPERRLLDTIPLPECDALSFFPAEASFLAGTRQGLLLRFLLREP